MARVPGFGPKDARIFIVGEFPSHDDAKVGKPFVGSDGRLLNEMLANAGIDRNSCYLTNVAKLRPPGGDFSVFYEDAKKTKPSQMLERFYEELKAELLKIRPNVIITLGPEALKAVTGKAHVSKWRGSILETPYGKVVPTYSPSFILRVYELRSIVELDLKKATRESISKTYNPPKTNFIIDPSFEQVMTWLQRPHNALALDIETVGGFETGQPITTRCLGLACSREESIVIPFTSSPNHIKIGSSILPLDIPGTNSTDISSHWSREEEKLILAELDRVFSDSTTKLIAQNFSFDACVLEKEFGFKFKNFVQDTMLAHHTLYPELPKGLDFLGSLYTDIPYWSDYDSGVDFEVWVYNAWDCISTFWVYEEIEKCLKETKLLDFYQNHIQNTLVAMTRTQNRGIQIDLEARDVLKKKTEKEIEVLRTRLSEIAEKDFNPDSPKQVAELLYGKLKLPAQMKRKATGSMGLTTEETALQELARKFPQRAKEVVDQILEFRGKRVLLSTFINAKTTPEGTMTTSYNVAGTVTGRLSSSSNFEGYGANLQNIPKTSFRRIYKARPGKVLIKTDLSQAEFRAVVWFAKVDRLIERFVEDPYFDVHSWNACNVYDIPLERVHEPYKAGETKSFRDMSKNGVYAGNYGMQPLKASKVYGIPLADATFILGKYRQTIPEIPNWWTEIQETLVRTRTIVNPIGRKRIFFGRLDDNMFRAAYSHLCQSTIGDIINRAIAILDYVLPEGCYPLIQVHDEIICEVDKDKVQQCLPLIKNAMEYPLKIDGVKHPLVIPCESNIGENWWDTTSAEKWLVQYA